MRRLGALPLSLQVQALPAGRIHNLIAIWNRFTFALAFLPPLDVIGAFGMDLCFLSNPDSVFQSAVALHESGKELPVTIYFDFLRILGRGIELSLVRLCI